jgi:hypothetical protein
MKKKRDKNAEDLDKNEVRHVVDVLHMVVKHLGAAHCRRVRVNVHEVKDPQRNDPCHLMKFSQQKLRA